MLTYCLKCKKDTGRVDSKILEIKSARPFLSSKCVVCGIKKSRLVKEQET